MSEESGTTAGRPPLHEVAEGVRAAIAAYTHALDDGRTDDVVATYWPDGTFDMPGLGRVEGHEALRTAYAGWAPRGPQRHLVVNTAIIDWDDREATAVSDVVLTTGGEAGWSIRFVARYHDTLRRDGDRWRFVNRSVSPA